MSVRLIHYSDSSSFGGAERALLTLLGALDRGRWNMTLAYHASPGIQPLLDGAAQTGAGLWAIPTLPEGRLGLGRIPALVAALRHMRPAVFHAHLTWQHSCKYGLLAAYLARVPAIIATVQLLVDLPESAVEQHKSRLLARGVGRYLAVSGATALRLRHELALPASRVQVVPNAVAPHQPNPQQAEHVRAELGRGRALVLTLARLEQQKGLETLITAAAHVPEAHFVIAGDGVLRQALEQQIHALGLTERIRLLGFRNDTAALLEACDLLVLPSWNEGLPLALLEAMAAGRTVVASAIPGNDEAVVHGQTGVLVPAGDVLRLARSIRALIACNELRQTMGAAALQRVQHLFSHTAQAKAVEHSYQEVLAARGIFL